MGRAVFPPCCLTRGQTMVDVMRIIVTSFKRPMYTLLYSVPLTLQQATAGLRQRLLDTHGQVWISLLWGHWFFLLGPDAYKVLFVPFKSLFPQLCVSSDGSVVGLMATSFKRAHAIPRSAAPRAPTPVSGHCWPISLQETLKHSSSLVFVGSLGPGVHKVCLNSLNILVGMGFDSKCDFTPPTILMGLLLCPWTWSISFWWHPAFSYRWLFSRGL